MAFPPGQTAETYADQALSVGIECAQPSMAVRCQHDGRWRTVHRHNVQIGSVIAHYSCDRPLLGGVRR